MEKRELVIIGAGPAGLTAAIYGRRAGLDVLVLEKGLPGGQINITDEIENWPGVQHATGAELGRMLKDHADKFKPEFRDTAVTELRLDNGSKVIVTDSGEIEAEAIIIATGASFRKLGCPGEAEHIGMGVSYCAVCDGAFFEDVEVAVIGGGNTAIEEAGYLTQFASKVYVVHRRDAWRADKLPIEKALANEKIVPVWNSVVESINGDEMVESLTLKNTKTGEASQLDVEGCFVFVGTVPNLSFLKEGQIARTKGNWIDADREMRTSQEGVFAAGDVIDKPLRQVVTAAGDGAVAAMSAYEYIAGQVHLRRRLFEPDEIRVLLFSSVDAGQARLAGDVEARKDLSVETLDAYLFARMAEKLGVTKLPAMVTLRRGEVVSLDGVKTVEDVEAALRA